MHRIEQLEVVPDRDVADQAALACQDHGDAAQRQACLARGNPVRVGIDETAVGVGAAIDVGAGWGRVSRDDRIVDGQKAEAGADPAAVGDAGDAERVVEVSCDAYRLLTCRRIGD